MINESIIMTNLKLKYSIFLSLFLIGNLFAQNQTKTQFNHSANNDSTNKFKFGVSGGVTILQIVSSMQYGDGYHYDFNSATGTFPSVRGGMISGELIYDLKHNPVSLVSDFSFVMSSVPMTQYNDTGLVIHESVFRKIGIGSVGLGFNIDGKYFFAGGRYRFGYCAGGYNNDPMPNIPEVVKNGQMNLRTNVYQSMEILLGAKYKNYQLVLRDAIPLTTPVVNNGGGYSGMIAVSLTLGYRF